MNRHSCREEIDAAFRRLYPRLSEEELVRAQRTFDRYLELVVRIVERQLGSDDVDPPKDPEQLSLF